MFVYRQLQLRKQLVTGDRRSDPRMTESKYEQEISGGEGRYAVGKVHISR